MLIRIHLVSVYCFNRLAINIFKLSTDPEIEAEYQQYKLLECAFLQRRCETQYKTQRQDYYE